MPRFVLLWHDCPPEHGTGAHWDLMIEREGTGLEHRLATWRLDVLPHAWAESLLLEAAQEERETIAVALPDHRAHYLDYEGPLSGGRGTVSRIAEGAVEWIEDSADRIAVRISASSPGHGGMVKLIRGGRSTEEWLLVWRSEGPR